LSGAHSFRVYDHCKFSELKKCHKKKPVFFNKKKIIIISYHLSVKAHTEVIVVEEQNNLPLLIENSKQKSFAGLKTMF
jgi:hypothetical protein